MRTTLGKAKQYCLLETYADNYNHDNNRWDTWGRFLERSAAYQPWIWTAGNHELDFAPELVSAQLFSLFMLI